MKNPLSYLFLLKAMATLFLLSLSFGVQSQKIECQVYQNQCYYLEESPGGITTIINRDLKKFISENKSFIKSTLDLTIESEKLGDIFRDNIEANKILKFKEDKSYIVLQYYFNSSFINIGSVFLKKEGLDISLEEINGIETRLKEEIIINQNRTNLDHSYPFYQTTIMVRFKNF
jgi:transposase